jgi:hypothetical protein
VKVVSGVCVICCRVLGVRVGSVLFTGLVLTGQLVLSLGSYLASVEVMDLGR